MKKILSVLTALSFVGANAAAQDEPSLAPPGCDYGAPHPNAPEEISQFSFLIGDYTITLHAWQGDQWSPPQPGTFARWNGYYGLGGMAIIDEWFNPDPGLDPDAPRGVNVRMYDKEAGEWDMMWIATGGNQVQDLRAAVKDDVLTMWQIYPERPNFKAEFFVEDEDHWYRVGYTKDDAGAWVKNFKLAATRIACDGDAIE